MTRLHVSDPPIQGFGSTWDGLPVARDKPYGVSILVWRDRGDREWLMLHRKHHGPDYAGDWAWTPPSGARLPDETVLECAERELREETGLSLRLVPTRLGSPEWHAYVARASPEVQVELDAEHDRYEWVSLEEAAARCLPAFVGQSFRTAEAWLESSLS